VTELFSKGKTAGVVTVCYCGGTTGIAEGEGLQHCIDRHERVADYYRREIMGTQALDVIAKVL
jgi:hypothetical protein